MCGIVGYIGRRDAVPVLLEGLRSLEYRGYDSAGLAVVHRNRLQVTKTAGRVQELRDRVEDRASAATGRTAGTKATIGIGHTRWATHGEPNEVNAHPHTDTEGRIAVVHNGIIENAEQLRDALIASGVKLVSETDTEALAHMIAAAATEGTSLQDAVRQTLRHVEGTYGLVVLDTKNPHELVVARNGSPIVLGIGESEMFVASDVAALVRYTKQVVYLDDAEVATVHASDYLTSAIDERDRPSARASTTKEPTTVEAEAGDYELGSFENYMRKEIHEQHRNPVVDPDTLYVAVSQSGETLDTLMAVQELRRKGGQVIGAVNVVGSAIGRECGHGVFLHAGPEIAVCSTKALTNMAATFALLALLLGRVRDMSAASGQRIVAGMRALPGQIEQILAAEQQIAEIARQFAEAEHMFFIGRVRGWPVAREGAQKLKEVSYVHAEAYQAAELKHGPLALINSSMPSLVIVPSDDLLSKNVSTIEQIKARGGPVIAVTSAELPSGLADAVVRVPRGEPELEPLLLNVPLQLLAYHVAAKLGRDIDKPRNLAKSVTVE